MEKEEEKTQELINLLDSLGQVKGTFAIAAAVMKLRDFIVTVYNEGYENGYKDGVENWADGLPKK